MCDPASQSNQCLPTPPSPTARDGAPEGRMRLAIRSSFPLQMPCGPFPGPSPAPRSPPHEFSAPNSPCDVGSKLFSVASSKIPPSLTASSLISVGGHLPVDLASGSRADAFIIIAIVFLWDRLALEWGAISDASEGGFKKLKVSETQNFSGEFSALLFLSSFPSVSDGSPRTKEREPGLSRTTAPRFRDDGGVYNLDEEIESIDRGNGY